MLKIAVTDANIFIDLLALKLINEFFRLDIDIWTTEEVLLELYPDDRLTIMNQNRIFIGQSQSIDEIISSTMSRHFSKADRSLMYLVYRKQAILISGEKRMRTWCKKNKIEVHGIIWVLQLLVDNGLITTHNAANNLSHLLSINDWLPTDKCLERIEMWRNNT